jgi:hypothetical protein
MIESISSIENQNRDLKRFVGFMKKKSSISLTLQKSFGEKSFRSIKRSVEYCLSNPMHAENATIILSNLNSLYPVAQAAIPEIVDMKLISSTSDSKITSGGEKQMKLESKDARRNQMAFGRQDTASAEKLQSLMQQQKVHYVKNYSTNLITCTILLVDYSSRRRIVSKSAYRTHSRAIRAHIYVEECYS